MYVVPLLEAAKGTDAGKTTRVAGPEITGSEQLALPARGYGPGDVVLTQAFDLLVIRGPSSRLIAPRAPTWAAICGLDGASRVIVAGEEGLELGGLNLALLAPGAVARLEVDPGAAAEVIAAPAQTRTAVVTGYRGEVELGGVHWKIRRQELEPALAPRDKVKVVESNLWRPPAPPGVWQVGSEIRSDILAFGVFRTGAPESTHKHQRTWELYQVLEGSLDFHLRPYRLGPWEPVTLTQGQALLLPPGTGHLVSERSDHLSMVFQSPAAGSDREIVSYSPRNPSLDLPFDE